VPLKKIGKIFVLIEIKQLTNCLFHHKTHLHIAIGHKSEQPLKIVEKVQTQRFVYFLVSVPSDDVRLLVKSKHFSLFVLGVALKLASRTLSAQFKFNNNVER